MLLCSISWLSIHFRWACVPRIQILFYSNLSPQENATSTFFAQGRTWHITEGTECLTLHPRMKLVKAPWCRLLLQKLIVIHIIQEHPSLIMKPKFYYPFTRTCHWTVFKDRCIQSVKSPNCYDVFMWNSFLFHWCYFSLLCINPDLIRTQKAVLIFCRLRDSVPLPWNITNVLNAVILIIKALIIVVCGQKNIVWDIRSSS
jgi:hypothetical protein